MSKYTSEVRFICESLSDLNESKGFNSVNDILGKAVKKVFDFEFPIFDEQYREVLEKKILKHYYTREIGEETYGLWKLRLDMKMNEIMPYYNKLYESELLEYNPLYTVNVTRKGNKSGESNKSGSEDVNENSNVSREASNTGTVDTTNHESGSSNTSTRSNGSNSSGSTDLYSDTPQGALTGVESGSYLTNARKVNESAESTGSGSSEGANTSDSKGSVSSSENTSGSESTSVERKKGTSDNANSTEEYLETVVGYEGKDLNEALKKYRENFLNIDMMVIEELEVLFMQLW